MSNTEFNNLVSIMLEKGPKRKTKPPEKVMDWDAFFDDVQEHEKEFYKLKKDKESLKDILMERFPIEDFKSPYAGEIFTQRLIGNMITDAIIDYDNYKQTPRKKEKKYYKVLD